MFTVWLKIFLCVLLQRSTVGLPSQKATSQIFWRCTKTGTTTTPTLKTFLSVEPYCIACTVPPTQMWAETPWSPKVALVFSSRPLRWYFSPLWSQSSRYISYCDIFLVWTFLVFFFTTFRNIPLFVMLYSFAFISHWFLSTLLSKPATVASRWCSNRLLMCCKEAHFCFCCIFYLEEKFLGDHM